MINQLFIQLLDDILTFVTLPALAIIGIAYYRKYRSKGGTVFAIGAISVAIATIFMKWVPIKFFVDDSTHILSPVGGLLASLALIIHVLGFIFLVIGLGIITFQKKK
jgi:hypothetical protein